MESDCSGRNADVINFEKTAVKVTIITIWGNVLLSVLKMIAGIIGHSGAMISDAIHSLSDVFSSIIVIIGVKLSVKESDTEHPYGHERFESVAAIILAIILFVTGLFVGYIAFEKICTANYSGIIIPGRIAAIAAVVSIIVKEAMFWYNKFYAKKLDSGALMADAWHHRSDALSSIGAFIGILGSRLGYPALDSIASLIISLFIIKVAYDVFKDSIEKMVDHCCDKKIEEQLRDCVISQEGVLGIDLLNTRKFGNKIYVDIEISADGDKTLYESHMIAEQVHSVIEERYPVIKHVMVHVNPACK